MGSGKGEVGSSSSERSDLELLSQYPSPKTNLGDISSVVPFSFPDDVEAVDVMYVPVAEG